MLGWFRRGDARDDERSDAHAYLEHVRPLHELLDLEFRSWLTEASIDGKLLAMERDPDGQHSAVYLYRVGPAALEFVQYPPVKLTRKYHEHFALCLEARAAAAATFKDAVYYDGSRDPARKVAEANKKLLEAATEHERAAKELAVLDNVLRPPF